MLNLAQYKLIRPLATAIELQNAYRLRDRIQESIAVIGSMLDKGYNHWIITFSGGKDSTSSLIISLEAAITFKGKVERIDIIYSDTTVEIPTINGYAKDFLKSLKKNPHLNGVDFHTHIVRPPIKDRYWVKLLGYGYPPPHQKFRWCTHRLKIRPVENKLKRYFKPDQTLIITGVRYGESQDRDKRLALSCSRGGECGQGLWFQYSDKLKVGYLAPLIDWTSCDVWDFINFVAPGHGFPTTELNKIYNGHDTRFGCWTCTVVRQDRAMERTIEQPEWAHLAPLAEFRNYIWQETRNANTRQLRDNGMPGRLKISTRKKLLKRLVNIQSSTKISLIDDQEIEAIKGIWKLK